MIPLAECPRAQFACCQGLTSWPGSGGEPSPTGAANNERFYLLEADRRLSIISASSYLSPPHPTTHHHHHHHLQTTATGTPPHLTKLPTSRLFRTESTRSSPSPLAPPVYLTTQPIHTHLPALHTPCPPYRHASLPAGWPATITPPLPPPFVLLPPVLFSVAIQSPYLPTFSPE